MGRSKAKGGRKPQPKSPVYLGLPDEACDTEQANDIFSTAAGGIPGWFSPSRQPPVEATVCDHCQGPMLLLLQAYAPLETSCYERVLYVWGCNTRQCMGQPGSFKVLRGHQYNHTYAMKLKPNKAQSTSTPTQQMPSTPAPSAPLKLSAVTAQPTSPLGGATGFQLGDLWGSGFSSVTSYTPSKLSGPLGGLSATPKSPAPSNTKALLADDDQDMALSKVTAQVDEIHLSASPADGDLSDSDYETMANTFTNGGLRAGPSRQSKHQLHHQADPLPTLLSPCLESALKMSNTAPEVADSGTRWMPNSHLPGYYLYTAEEVLEDSISSYDVADAFVGSPMNVPSSSKGSRAMSHPLAVLASSPPSDSRSNQTSNASAASGQSPTPKTAMTAGKDGTWKDETYERDSLPSGMDRGLQRFLERVAEWPDQCIRYDLGGIPLLYSFQDTVAKALYSVPTTTTLLSSPVPTSPRHSTSTSTPPASMTRALPQYSTQRIPKCQYCGELRVFECQLMPNLLLLLQTERHAAIALQRSATTRNDTKAQQKRSKGLPSALAAKGMEWGTVLIFSCRADCHPVQAKDAFFQECALVQLEQE